MPPPAGANLKDPKFLQAFVLRNTRHLAMAGKLLFPIPEPGLVDRLYRSGQRLRGNWLAKGVDVAIVASVPFSYELSASPGQTRPP